MVQGIINRLSFSERRKLLFSPGLNS